MFFSVLFSHQAMLFYQTRAASDTEGTQTPLASFRRSITQKLVCWAAVLSRFIGRTLAVINSLWIITWCLLTFTNIMHQPTCGTAYLALGDRGWIYLWNFSFVYKMTRKQELACVVASLVVLCVVCSLIWTLTPKKYEGTRRFWLSRIGVGVGIVLAFAVAIIPLAVFINSEIESKTFD